jgi:DNA-binding XRE family transcriptional regulator
MNAPIRHQIIEDKGQPLFVLVPYSEYVASLNRETGESLVIPLAVSKAANMEDKSLVRAWREYKGFSQADMAERMSISRPAYAQLEAKGANLRATTLHRLAAALDVQWEQLCEDEE